MNQIEPDIEGYYQDVAYRLRSLASMFNDLGTDQGAERLLRTLVADDGGEFRELIGRYDLPKFPELGLCVWVREVLDSVLLTPIVDESCSLRENLTDEEKLVVLRLASRFQVILVVPWHEQTIAPGPFLDALKERGLVVCPPAPTQNRPLSLLGPYTRYCV